MEQQALTVGIIGCGALGVIHARRFGDMSGIRVIALSDPSPAGMDRAAAELPQPPERTSEDWRDLLKAPPDIVCIASPDAFHVEQVLAALSAGSHVLCEKPLTPNVQELEAVIKAKSEAGRHVAMTYPRRYDPGIRRMREEILSGKHGSVTSVTVYNAEDWVTPNVGTWRHDPAICPGGFFYDASGHQLDTLFWVTGLRGASVRARVDNRGTGVPLVITGMAALSNGAPVTFAFVGDATAWREQINIHCERADFTLQNGRAYRVAGTALAPLAPEGDEVTADACFVELVRGEGPDWAPPEELWPVLTFTNAALQSGRSGNEEAVPEGGVNRETR